MFGAVKTALDEGDTRIQAEHIPSPYQSAKPFTFPVSYTDKSRVPDEQIKLKDTPKPADPVPFRPKTEFVANAPSEKLEDESEAETDEDILLNSQSSAPKNDYHGETVTEVPLPINSDEFEEEQFRLIGEAFMTYIICEYKNKLVIIDKHAAHERIIYERLKKSEGERTGQLLLSPVTVNLPKDEYAAVLDNLEIINSSGFDVEDFGGGSVLVRECPMELSFDDVPDIIAEIAGRFVEKRQDVMFEKLDWIFHSVMKEANKRYITSFSVLEDNLTMWRLYGDDAKGVCLEFMAEYDTPNLYPVHYEEDNGVQNRVAQLKAELASSNLQFKFLSLERKWQYYMKPACFSEEKEIRLLIEDVKPKKWDLPSTGVIKPYIECGLFESAKDAEPFPLKLERIILGPNMKEQARNKHQIELMVQSMLYPVYLHVEPSKHNCYI